MDPEKSATSITTTVLLGVGSGVAGIVIFFLVVGFWVSGSPARSAALSQRTPAELVIGALVVFAVTGGGVLLGLLALRRRDHKP
ncbi:MAG: hypothetical protein ACRD2R_04995 [Terriglobales bacterium]